MLNWAKIAVLSSLSFEIGPIRPPNEGGGHSLLLRFTRNCPWGRCKFCYASPYHREKFELRSLEEIKGDIDAARAIAEDVKAVSWKLGYGGKVNEPTGAAIVQRDPMLASHPPFVTVFNWLFSDARTAFLQDADSLIMPAPGLVEGVKYLKETFPSLERLTSYARSKTLLKKSGEELKALRQAGLSRLHVGLETGDDELLAYVEKGVTAAGHIEAGKKAKEAGFELSFYVMPDLGGRARSEPHALNTARVLTEINPHFIRMRPFVPRPDTPLFEEYLKGELKLSSPHERLRELKLLIENLEVTSRVCFDHFLNCWYQDRTRRQTLFTQDYNGYQFPEEKERVLELIELGLRLDEAVHIHPEQLLELPHL